jgi:hypothetical protein
MALAKYYEDIVDQRRANGVAIMFDYQHPQENIRRAALTGSSECHLMPPSELAEIRLWLQQENKECEERLAREQMLIFKLNEQRTKALPVGFLPKREAAKTIGVFKFELLELDNYGGMFVRADHLFISQTKVVEGLRRYAPEALLNGLLNERHHSRVPDREAVSA